MYFCKAGGMLRLGVAVFGGNFKGGGIPNAKVEGDVPVENMMAFIEEVQKQPGYPG